MTSSPSIPTEGALLGRYRCIRELAKGPFGPLLELRTDDDANTLAGMGRVIALPKELTEEASQLISDAAWDTLEIRHDLAQAVADVVFGDGWITLVHDHTEGSLLKSLLRRAQERQSAFPLAVAIRVVLDVLDALELTHRASETAGVAYRPGGTSVTSLYLCGDGRTRTLDAQLMTTLVATEKLRVTVDKIGYPPPELFLTNPTLDERSDVYVVAAVLWELLSGKDLQLEREVLAGKRQRSRAPHLSLSLAKGSSVPRAIIQIVNSALELDPDKRPATRAELRNQLSSASEAATYDKVIDFTDALLHRESTLFRLTLDPEPKLSDEIRVERPASNHLSFAVELAKQARAVEAQRSTVAQSRSASGTLRPLPILPTAIFASGAPAAPQVQATEPPAPRVSAPPAVQASLAPATFASAAPMVNPGLSPRRTLMGITAEALAMPQPAAAKALVVLTSEPKTDNAAETIQIEKRPSATVPLVPLSISASAAKTQPLTLTTLVGKAESLVHEAAPRVESKGSAPLASFQSFPQTTAAVSTSSGNRTGVTRTFLVLAIALSNLLTALLVIFLVRERTPRHPVLKPNMNLLSTSVVSSPPALPAAAPLASTAPAVVEKQTQPVSDIGNTNVVAATPAPEASAVSPGMVSKPASTVFGRFAAPAKPMAPTNASRAPASSPRTWGKRVKKYTPREL